MNVIMKVTFDEEDERLILETAQLSENGFAEIRGMMMKARRIRLETKTDDAGCRIISELTDEWEIGE